MAYLAWVLLSRVIRARYEKGVLKPLDKVDLEEGEKVVISIRRDVPFIMRKYGGSWEG